MSSHQGANVRRSGGGVVDYADRQRTSHPGFSAQVGNLRFSVPSLRRSARHRAPAFVARWLLWTLGAGLLVWGLYSAGLVLVHRGGGQEILSSLLAVFGGSLLIFLAGHDQAVQRRLEQRKSDSASGRSAAW